MVYKEDKPVIVACIPAYNEEKYIAKVIVETKKYVDKIIVCDDGSRDLTAEIARELGAIVVKHNENKGYGAALRTLFKKALELDPDIIVTLDADGQHDPKEIPRLVEPILKGEADIVIGSRFLGKTTQPKWRILGVKAVTRTVKTAFNINEITDAQSGFRAYRASVVGDLIPEDNTMAASVEILAKARNKNLKIKEVPVTITSHEDASKHNPLYHLAVLIVGIIQLFTERHPLLLLGLPGLVSVIVSLVMMLRILLVYKETRIIDPILTTSVLILFTVGLLMVALGLVFYAIARLKQYMQGLGSLGKKE